MNRLIIILTLASACSLISATSHSAPLGPGFTYQGHLGQNGESVNGPIHLRFSLWDAAGVGQPPIGGTQIGASQLVTDVPVAEGVFNVLLNGAGEFGPNAFNGEARWLQIEVCADPGCAGLNILSPRQPLTASPYALNTVSAPWSGLTGIPPGFADGIDNIGDPVWVASGTDIYYIAGDIGVGTSTPDEVVRFHVVTDEPGRWAVLGDAPNGNGVVGIGRRPGFAAVAGINSSDAIENDLGGIGVYGEASLGSKAVGVYGIANLGIGVRGVGNQYGVSGFSDNPNGYGVYGDASSGDGVVGQAGTSGHCGVNGINFVGDGVVGQGIRGVYGVSFAQGGAGVQGLGGDGVALAGRFVGDIDVSGNVLKTADATRIDHPLDPENKYLIHSSVESPEAINVYSGNITTDENGVSVVILPDYFEAFNKDFRYQLTVIDGSDSEEFVLAKVVKEIEGNRFTIRSSQPNVKISWQVTGIRNDPYAKANPNEVEKVKSKEERGKYLRPELFGQPKEKGIHYRPELERPTEAVSKGE